MDQRPEMGAGLRQVAGMFWRQHAYDTAQAVRVQLVQQAARLQRARGITAHGARLLKQHRASWQSVPGVGGGAPTTAELLQAVEAAIDCDRGQACVYALIKLGNGLGCRIFSDRFDVQAKSISQLANLLAASNNAFRSRCNRRGPCQSGLVYLDKQFGGRCLLTSLAPFAEHPRNLVRVYVLAVSKSIALQVCRIEDPYETRTSSI